MTTAQIKLLSFFLAVCLAVSALSGCRQSKPDGTDGIAPSVTGDAAAAKTVDYAGSIKLNMNSETAKQEVTVKTFVDGDTTHFHVPSGVNSSGVLKARYLAVNTPESTGMIEEYGKAASKFTKEKLSSAVSIVIESETAQWNPDSTGGRYLVWVWYKTSETEDYRNLNIEILQNGLSVANSTANNRYGSAAMEALNQAKRQKLNLFSGQKDPDFYYGEAVELTLKELRTNIKKYEGIKVAFNGVVATAGNNSVYVEAYDPELDLYFGISAYYGFNLTGAGLDILSIGNEVRIVGTVQYYEAGGTYQISDLNYRMMKPDDPGNIQKISDGHHAAYVLTDADTFVKGKVQILSEDRYTVWNYADLAMSSTIQMDDLYVRSVYTTEDPESSSCGAMTLTCEVNGLTVKVRTAVLRDRNGNLITEDTYLGKTISVKGVIESFNGENQIKVYSADSITIYD